MNCGAVWCLTLFSPLIGHTTNHPCRCPSPRGLQTLPLPDLFRRRRLLPPEGRTRLHHRSRLDWINTSLDSRWVWKRGGTDGISLCPWWVWRRRLPNPRANPTSTLRVISLAEMPSRSHVPAERPSFLRGRWLFGIRATMSFVHECVNSVIIISCVGATAKILSSSVRPTILQCTFRSKVKKPYWGPSIQGLSW